MNAATPKPHHWRTIAEAIVTILVGLIVAVLVAQLVILNTANRQLHASLAAVQSENVQLKADNATLVVVGSDQASQNVALRAQVTALKSKMATVLGDERVGRAFFQSFLGLLDSGTIRQETCSASFLTTTALRQECGYVESYYDQIDSIASAPSG